MVRVTEEKKKEVPACEDATRRVTGPVASKESFSALRVAPPTSTGGRKIMFLIPGKE
jgi:hypothetical protein